MKLRKVFTFTFYFLFFPYLCMMQKKRSVYEEILGIFTGNCAYDVLRGVSKPAEKQWLQPGL